MVEPAEVFKFVKIKESDIELLKILLTTANIKGSEDLNESFQRIALITRAQDALARTITENEFREMVIVKEDKKKEKTQVTKEVKKTSK